MVQHFTSDLMFNPTWIILTTLPHINKQYNIRISSLIFFLYHSPVIFHICFYVLVIILSKLMCTMLYLPSVWFSSMCFSSEQCEWSEAICEVKTTHALRKPICWAHAMPPHMHRCNCGSGPEKGRFHNSGWEPLHTARPLCQMLCIRVQICLLTKLFHLLHLTKYTGPRCGVMKCFIVHIDLQGNKYLSFISLQWRCIVIKQRLKSFKVFPLKH